MLREWKLNLFWMAVQLCAAYGVGAIALRLLESHGAQHSRAPASMLGFLAYFIVVVIQAWWYETTHHHAPEPYISEMHTKLD